MIHTSTTVPPPTHRWVGGHQDRLVRLQPPRSRLNNKKRRFGTVDMYARTHPLASVMVWSGHPTHRADGKKASGSPGKRNK
jgi:hypothetical protein